MLKTSNHTWIQVTNLRHQKQRILHQLKLVKIFKKLKPKSLVSRIKRMIIITEIYKRKKKKSPLNYLKGNKMIKRRLNNKKNILIHK
jgi:uncharacterized protein (UPF0128 family)